MYFLFRVIITATIGYLVISHVGLAVITKKLSYINISTLLICLGVLLTQLFCTSFRWHILTTTMTNGPGWKKMLQYYWIGIFFNQALPSSFGGDAMRVYLLQKDLKSKAQALASVGLERTLGLATLILIALVSSPEIIDDIDVSIPESYFGIGFLGLISIAYLTHKMKFLDKLAKIFRRLSEESLKIFRGLTAKPSYILLIAVLSVATHLLTIFIAWILLKQFGIYVDYLKIVSPVSIAMLLSALPITVSSWGVRETSLVLLLGPLGVEPETAVATGVSMGLITLIFSLVGGAFYSKGSRLVV